MRPPARASWSILARPAQPLSDNRAVFSMELSQEGALLMRASLTDPGATRSRGLRP
jgi:hypothetical protein